MLSAKKPRARPRGIRPPPQLPLRHRNGRHPHTHRSRSGLLGVRRAALPKGAVSRKKPAAFGPEVRTRAFKKHTGQTPLEYRHKTQ